MSGKNIIYLDANTCKFIQSRAEMNFAVVDEYKREMERGVSFDPVQAIKDDKGEYWVWDGNHRGEAAKASNVKLAVCFKSGSRNDAEWLSLTANHKAVLMRSNADKRRVIQLALLHPNGANKSNRAIADHCGVSDKTVASVRSQLIEDGLLEKQEDIEVNRNGTVYRQKLIKHNEPRKTTLTNLTNKIRWMTQYLFENVFINASMANVFKLGSNDYKKGIHIDNDIINDLEIFMKSLEPEMNKALKAHYKTAIDYYIGLRDNEIGKLLKSGYRFCNLSIPPNEDSFYGFSFGNIRNVDDENCQWCTEEKLAVFNITIKHQGVECGNTGFNVCTKCYLELEELLRLRLIDYDGYTVYLLDEYKRLNNDDVFFVDKENHILLCYFNNCGGVLVFDGNVLVCRRCKQEYNIFDNKAGKLFVIDKNCEWKNIIGNNYILVNESISPINDDNSFENTVRSMFCSRFQLRLFMKYELDKCPGPIELPEHFHQLQKWLGQRDLAYFNFFESSSIPKQWFKDLDIRVQFDTFQSEKDFGSKCAFCGGYEGGISYCDFFIPTINMLGICAECIDDIKFLIERGLVVEDKGYLKFEAFKGIILGWLIKNDYDEKIVDDINNCTIKSDILDILEKYLNKNYPGTKKRYDRNYLNECVFKTLKYLIKTRVIVASLTNKLNYWLYQVLNGQRFPLFFSDIKKYLDENAFGEYNESELKIAIVNVQQKLLGVEDE